MINIVFLSIEFDLRLMEIKYKIALASAFR